METNHDFASPRAAFDPQIARLLDHVDESDSIVDRLMSIPNGDAGETAAEWERAVARRLERKLSATLRDLIEGEGQKKSA